MSRTPYQNMQAVKYAKAYCSQNNNECGVYLSGSNLSDCAHFLAHCLQAGGITIKKSAAEDPLCPHGLTTRNTVLVDALRALAAKYDNVKEIDLGETILGDVGFLKIERPRHAFLVSKPGPLPGGFNVPFVWAHSSSRCDAQLDTDWRQWLSTAFRLEDG